jgi:hypothetical protein
VICLSASTRRTAINKFERAWRETEKEEEPDEKS